MSQDFFQCLVCNTFFGNLWKVEKHIKQHDNENGARMENANVANVPLRRGMLPILKVSFRDCFVPVVKNQIDPAFLEQYTTVEAKEEPATVEDNVVKASTNFRRGRKTKTSAPVFVDTEEERKPRKCQLKAVANIRRAAAAVLRIPDRQSDECDEEREDFEFVQDLLDKLSDEDKDVDFKPPSYVNKDHVRRKVGRPFGSLGKQKQYAGGVRPKSSRKRKIAKDTTDESKFECEYCTESFSIRTELNMHLYKNHQEQANMLTCPIMPCGIPFLNFFYLRAHLKLHNDAERKEYSLLEKMDSTKKDGKDDKGPDVDVAITNLNSNVSSISCKYCLEKFKSFPQLQKHISKDHNSNSILKCPCCDKNISQEEGIIKFISHLKGFHPKFLDPFDQRAKERDENRLKEKRFKCDKCSATYHYKNQLEKHLEFHERREKRIMEEENDASRRFTCPVCNKKFKYKDNLRRHFTLHLENNPYVCDFPGCNRKFNSDYNLRRHKTLHIESDIQAQRVHCPLCDQSFSRKDKLPKHLREFHKPSDINSPSLTIGAKIRKYQCRLPHCSRIPKYPTYKDLNKDGDNNSPSTSTTTEAQGEIKIEAVESTTTMEEIHLVDRILLDSDGHAVHVKGEQLNPEKVSSNLPSQTRESHSEGAVFALTDVPVPTIQTTSLTKLIVSDPIFEKLANEDPSKIKDVVTANYNYKLKRNFDCHICEAVFTRAWTLQLHLKTQHNQTLMDQKQSTAILSNDEDETEALNKQPITLMCGTCAYPAKNATELAKHVKLSHEPKMRCKCGLYFDSRRRLHIHIREIHNGERKFKCKFCSQAFTKRDYVRAHERKVHEDSGQPRKMKKCPVPGCYRVVAPSSYYQHLKNHNDDAAADELQREKKHKCMLCGDILCNAMALRRHIDAIHLGKPINRRRKDVRLKDPSPGTVIRRGPKSAGDEWFQPLLEKIGFAPKNKQDQLNGVSVNGTVIVEDSLATDEASVDDDLVSILGF